MSENNFFSHFKNRVIRQLEIESSGWVKSEYQDPKGRYFALT
jgi:hypothetical protein